MPAWPYLTFSLDELVFQASCKHWVGVVQIPVVKSHRQVRQPLDDFYVRQHIYLFYKQVMNSIEK